MTCTVGDSPKPPYPYGPVSLRMLNSPSEVEHCPKTAIENVTPACSTQEEIEPHRFQDLGTAVTSGQSLGGETSSLVTADPQILSRVKHTGSMSNFGITRINAAAYTDRPLEAAGRNYTARKLNIGLITACMILKDSELLQGPNVAAGRRSNSSMDRLIRVPERTSLSSPTACRTSTRSRTTRSRAGRPPAPTARSWIWRPARKPRPRRRKRPPTGSRIDTAYNGLCSTVQSARRTTNRAKTEIARHRRVRGGCRRPGPDRDTAGRGTANPDRPTDRGRVGRGVACAWSWRSSQTLLGVRDGISLP
jgi:hypothetical protein